MSKPIVARSRRPSPILVCKKCLGRCPAGRDIKQAVKAELKCRRSDASKPARLVATGCLGICPKKAVVFASGQSLRDGEFILVTSRHEIGDALSLLGVSDASS